MDRFWPIEDFRRSYKGAGDSINIDGLNKNSSMQCVSTKFFVYELLLVVVDFNIIYQHHHELQSLHTIYIRLRLNISEHYLLQQIFFEQ